MSILIDRLLKENDGSTRQQSQDGEWYIAAQVWNWSLKRRVLEAFKVFRGRAKTYHYKSEEEQP